MKKTKSDADILKRLQIFWLRRIDNLQITNKRETHLLEPIAFGWWFISGKFNDTWAIEQLMIAIELAGKIEPEHSVLKHLSKIAAEMPLLVVECLDEIFVKNENEHKIYNFITIRRDSKYTRNSNQ